MRTNRNTRGQKTKKEKELIIFTWYQTLFSEMNMKWPVKGMAHSKMKTLDLRYQCLWNEWKHMHTYSTHTM